MSDKSSADLERDAERVRAELADTTEQLRGRMSPGQLMDEALQALKGGDAQSLLTNLKAQAVDNPMALALIGSGVAWLMAGSGRSPEPRGSYAGRASGGYEGRMAASEWPEAPGGYVGGETRDTSWTESATEGASDLRDAAVGRAGEFGAAVSDRAGAVAEQARSVGTTISDTVDAAAERGREAWARARHAGRGTAAGLQEAANDWGAGARGAFGDMLSREPLVIGALGLAVGAAVGAMLPASELEREKLGTAGEALRDRAEELAGAGMAKAKQAAGEIYESAREEAERQGLVSGEGSVAEGVGSVLRRTGEKATEVADRELGEATGSGDGESRDTTEGRA